MPSTYKLRIDGTDIGIRQVEADTFVPKNISVLKQIVKTTTGIEKAPAWMAHNKDWGGRVVDYPALDKQTLGKINLGSQAIVKTHRCGWQYAINSLRSINNNDGVMFDGFLERNFAWFYQQNAREKEHIPYTKPWVGFFHNPPNHPDWFLGDNCIDKIIERPEFQASLEQCMGLFALSEYHADYLRKKTGVTVSSLLHPTEIPDSLFSYEAFIANGKKKIVNIGYWLRKLNSIYCLPVADTYTKIKLVPYCKGTPLTTIEDLTETEKRIYEISHVPEYYDNTKVVTYMSNIDYDDLLSKNVVFLDLYDSSANNAIIECIARGTPILVNPIPAVVEYLGEDYPLYFNTLEEAAEKVLDLDLVKQAHEYLLTCDTRQKLSSEYFLKSFTESDVYKGLKLNWKVKAKHVWDTIVS